MVLNSRILLDVDLTKNLPTFGEMIKYYGPYLGLVLSLIITILILQFVWFVKISKAKDEEVKRLIKREEDLNARILSMIDQEIGYTSKKRNNK